MLSFGETTMEESVPDSVETINSEESGNDSVQVINSEESTPNSSQSASPGKSGPNTRNKKAVSKKNSQLKTSPTDWSEKRFVCNICNKGFRRKCRLDSHLTTHSEDASSCMINLPSGVENL
ncbi:unnamed protein product [Larinioides sclopetarius]|uniref:C2H2-type domain-containing protein n=1 Tax=Larinioides sclopetarius TaxID=280406 RepID=A0AAV2B5P8_9ARAC